MNRMSIQVAGGACQRMSHRGPFAKDQSAWLRVFDCDYD